MSDEHIDDLFNRAPEPATRTMTDPEIMAHLKWSEPKEVTTKYGQKMLSQAKAFPEFFEYWAREKHRLGREGYSMSEWKGKWTVCHWTTVPEKIIVERRASIEMSRATDAEINVPAPDGLAYLGYQRAGIAFGHTRPGILLGDEMGLGKTIQAIGLINARPDAKKILIICPASLKLNWRRELEKWLTQPRTIFIADSKIFPEINGIVIINYDILHKHEDVIKGTEWDMLIVDEAHFLKNPKSRRGKMVFGLEATQKEKKNGAADIPGIDACKRILLTGTPICNKPVELWPLIHYLDPITWNNFFRYALRYCAANQGSHGWDFSGASNLNELQEKLRSTIMIRRLKKDVLTELPPKRRQVIELQADGTALRAIKAELAVYGSHEDGLEQMQARIELAKASDTPGEYEAAVKALDTSAKTVFSEIAKLRHDTTMAKLPACIEHLKDAVEESEKVVCFVHHKDACRAIKEAFGSEAVTLVGDDAMEDRQAAVDRFQKDPTCKLFIGSIMAAGVGITLTAAAHVVMVELDWVPGNVSQAEDRCHRIGQKESVLVQHLVLEGSLDATMAKRIIAKQEVIDQALDKASAEPVVASKHGHATATTTRDQLAAEADALTIDQMRAAQEAIRMIASHCNGARSWDGAGFSKIDTNIGHDLAGRPDLSRKQCALARKIALKYRRQLPEQLADRLK